MTPVERRAFLVGTLGLLTASRAVEAQPAGKVYRIGILSSSLASAPAIEALRQGLRELGWVEGQNIVIDYRFTEGRLDRLPALAGELVRLKVDVIAAGPTPPALAAKNATGTIPIVMLGAAQPVELGLITSLARPGGNVTGMSWSVSLEIIGKGLDLLKETFPKIRRVGILWNPANPAQALALKDVKRAAQSLGLQLQIEETRGPDEFDGAFAAMAKHRAEALLVVPDSVVRGRPSPTCRSRGQAPTALNARAAAECRRWEPHVVWSKHRRHVATRGVLHGQDPAGGQAW